MSQLRVFVSHSSSDKAFADALVRALRQAGADVWYDEHNLGAGQVLDDIQRELATRPAFIIVLSKAAFASVWVRRECKWAFNLYDREPERILLPVVASPIDRDDFNTILFLEDFKRVEGPGNRPYPPTEAIQRTLHLLALTLPGEPAAARAPQPGESVQDLLVHGKALAA
jgi:TIR domain